MEDYELKMYSIDKATRMGVRNATRGRILKYLEAWRVPHRPMDETAILRKLAQDKLAEHEATRSQGQASLPQV